MGLCFSSSIDRLRPSSGAAAAIVPLGKRTRFGYSTDFEVKYKLGKQLGHGQFGRTYVAVEVATGKQVAVKVIGKGKMSASDSVEDVRREVTIMEALSGHECTVQFYEAFEDDNYVYIAMELCLGGELLERISTKKKNPYTERDAASVVRKMLNVVAWFHLHGIVHRDLKPENFLFVSQDEDSALKAIDFGLSNYIKPGKVFRDVVGSPFYMAPEVLKKKSGPASDVWSIGVITYFLLCGRRPFSHKKEEGIFDKILVETPDFQERPWPSISPSAKDLLNKMLIKNPKARITAAEALSHPWVRDGKAPDIPLDITVLSNIREYVEFSRIRKIALRAFASSLNGEERVHLQDQFNAIDTNKNGTISLEEIHQAFAKDKSWRMREPNVSEILLAMDTDANGQVDFNEFAAAALHVRPVEGLGTRQWKKRCNAAFQKLDVDKDGYITPEELKLYTNTNGSINELIEEADLDKDGRISLHEFQLLLQGGVHRA